MLEGLDKVELNIKEVFGRRKAAAMALCRKYALVAEHRAKAKQGTAQGSGNIWTNRLSKAVTNIEGHADDHGDSVSCRIAHHMEYGKWLELANNRKHAVLEPTIRELVPEFIDEVRKVFQG